MVYLIYYDKNGYIVILYEFCLQFDYKYLKSGGCMGYC